MQVHKDVKKLEYLGEEDPLKVSYLKKLISEAKDSKLIFVMSPMWYGVEESGLSNVKQLCADNNVPFIDFSNNPEFVHNSQFFHDGGHMNEKGANTFSMQLANILRTYVNP